MFRFSSPARWFLSFLLVLLAAPFASGQDINGDGRVDAVFTQKQHFNQVCFGNGKGNFTTCSDLIGAGQFQLSSQINTTAAALIDWDGDGDLDIALAMEGHASVVCYNDGGGQFNAGLGCIELYGYSTFPYNTEDVAAGDVNGDGAADLVFANGGNAGLPLDQPNMVCLQHGGCYEFGTDAPSTGVALGDMDNDGDVDVVVSNSGTQNEVCLNNGSGRLFDCRAITQAANVSPAKVSNAVVVGHLPGGFNVAPDTWLDVVFANTGRNERCFGDGNWAGTNVGLTCSGFNPVTSYTTTDANARTTDVVLADLLPQFAGPEIIFVNADAPNNRWIGTFAASGVQFNETQIVNVDIGGTIYAVSEPITEQTVGAAARDINMDGKIDVVVANTGSPAGISRTYLGSAYSTSVVANNLLQPTSVTLSGGNVGPSVDTTPPAFFGASNVTVEASSANGATAQFTVTAIDVDDGTRSVTCTPVSGSQFPIGNTTVTCTASDTSNNQGTASFLVSVVDTTGPVVTVPGNLSIFATPGQTTAAVPFSVSAVDAVDGSSSAFCYNVATNYGVLPGDQLPGGTITVKCGAYDTRHNYREASFSVTVITDIDSDGILDNVDPDDDNDGIADSVDAQPTIASTGYAFDATNTGTVTRNGWTVSIAPAPAGSAYSMRASISGAGTAPAVITAYCGFRRKELRFDTAGETAEWRCDGTTLAVKFVSGVVEFWKVVFSGGVTELTRITPTAGSSAASAGSPVTADATNTSPIEVAIFNEAMTQIGSFSLDPGESVDVDVVNGELQLELLNGGPDGKVIVTLFNQPVTLQQGNGPATFSMTQTVFASGTAAVTTWDPIFPNSAYSPWQSQCSAAPSVGPNAGWVNPHAAFSFPPDSHPWENIPPFNFAANWINAWSDLNSRGPAGQSWTKYTTEVTGEGDFVVQFLADNCSWIYLDDQLIGVQDDNWSVNGTGRYPATLTGAGPHTLSFIIWDGGGAAGGKFRLETRQSFIDGGGDPDDLPVKGPSTTTVSFGAGPFTYTGSAFIATASVSPGGDATITYSGDCTNAGSSCTATATYDGDSTHFGSTATASITIDPVPTTTSVSFGAASYVYTGSAIGATASAGATITYSGSCTNVGTCTATATTAGDANHIGSQASAQATIVRATATIAATPYDVEYDGQPHTAAFTITGVNGETGAIVGTVTQNTTHTNVGTYSDTWSFAGANYAGIGATTIINKIKDTTAPVITSVSNNAPSLWPPNHKMVAVSVSALANDLVGVTSLKIINVTSSEPDNGLGDGDTAGDVVITGPLSVNLRAERGGGGNGRTYTITVEARDAAGNATTKTCTVVVPKSQGGK